VAARCHLVNCHPNVDAGLTECKWNPAHSLGEPEVRAGIARLVLSAPCCTSFHSLLSLN
jgi:hypothetical protein